MECLGGAGSNKQHTTTKNTAKLDRETEELKHDHVPLELGKLIQQARQGKNLSQKDLASVSIMRFATTWCVYVNFIEHINFVLQRVNEKPQVIQEYENGKAIPDQAVLSKMERTLCKFVCHLNLLFLD